MRSSRSASPIGHRTRGTTDVTRPLKRLDPQLNPVLGALRDALSGSGPAIFVGDTALPLPAEVAQRIALVVETSGSTARPKRVALSSDALLASAAASASAIGGHGQWLVALPLHYIAGLNVLVRSIASETEPVAALGPSFDPLAFAAAAGSMDDSVPHFTSLVPAQLSRVLAAPAAATAAARFERILLGGQSAPPELLEAAVQAGLRVATTYGSSETCGGCVYDGAPIGNTAVRISDGEVELSGAVLAEGYLEDDGRTAAAFVNDAGTRWYRTGDTGEYTEGRLAILGRLDDVIISGGIKVSLADVERVARVVEGQSDAVAVRAPSEQWGEVPVIVTTRPIELEDLRAVVRAALGPAAAPARVIVVDAIPLLRSGKPDRVELQRLAH
jgi:o-succinylbenzoate---CoA ligase